MQINNLYLSNSHKLIETKSVDAIALYHFYAHHASIQSTNQIWINNQFVMAGLDITLKRLRKAKKLLIKSDLIREIHPQDDNGLFSKRYIQIPDLYITNQPSQPLGQIQPSGDVSSTGSKNHLVDKIPTNAYRENLNSYKDIKKESTANGDAKTGRDVGVTANERGEKEISTVGASSLSAIAEEKGEGRKGEACPSAQSAVITKEEGRGGEDTNNGSTINNDIKPYNIIDTPVIIDLNTFKTQIYNNLKPLFKSICKISNNNIDLVKSVLDTISKLEYDYLTLKYNKINTSAYLDHYNQNRKIYNMYYLYSALSSYYNNINVVKTDKIINLLFKFAKKLQSNSILNQQYILQAVKNKQDVVTTFCIKNYESFIREHKFAKFKSFCNYHFGYDLGEGEKDKVLSLNDLLEQNHLKMKEYADWYDGDMTVNFFTSLKTAQNFIHQAFADESLFSSIKARKADIRAYNVKYIADRVGCKSNDINDLIAFCLQNNIHKFDKYLDICANYEIPAIPISSDYLDNIDYHAEVYTAPKVTNNVVTHLSCVIYEAWIDYNGYNYAKSMYFNILKEINYRLKSSMITVCEAEEMANNPKLLLAIENRRGYSDYDSIAIMGYTNPNLLAS